PLLENLPMKRGSKLWYLIAHLPHMFVGVFVVLGFTRMVEPAEFGKFAASFAFVNVAGALSFGWLQTALVRLSRPNAERAGPSMALLFGALGLSSIPVFLLAYL